VPPLGAIAVLAWAQWSGTPWDALGFGRPASWLITIAGGLALGVALKLVLKAVVLPLLGAPATNPTYQQVHGDASALVQLLVVSIVVGGIGEEIFWRGFLFERLRQLLGGGAGPTIAIVVVTAVVFALAHFPDQGIPGVQQAIFTGLVLGAVYAWTGVLWPAMVAHAAYDVTAALIIYAGLEESVAHFIFK
jgi:CAAX protease family protein